MKTYIDHKELDLIFFEGAWIPKDLNNRNYLLFLEEQGKGEAQLVPHTKPFPTWEEIRLERDFLLKETDWVTAEDANPKPSKEAWLAYRQTLRNIPQFFPSPQSVVWPIKPS